MNKLLQNIEGWTQSGPMGNDKQSWGNLIGAGVGLLGNWIGGGSKQSIPKGPGEDEIRRMLQSSQDVIGQMQGGYEQMQGLGRDLMDPTSAINRQRFGLMQQQGQQNLALQNLLARRQAAAMGQASGITSAQADQRMQNMGQGLVGQYQQGMLGQQNVGLGMLGQAQGLLGNILKGQLMIDENIAGADVAQAARAREAALAAGSGTDWTELGGALGSALTDLWEKK